MLKRRLLLTGLFMCCMALLQAGGLPAEWKKAAVCRAGEGNLEFETVWDGYSPLEIGFRLEASGREFLLALAPQKTAFYSVPHIGVDNKRWAAVRETGWNPGTQIVTRMPVLIKFREDHWLFYLQRRLVAYVPAPGNGAVEIRIPDRMARRLRREMRFYHVPRVRYSTDFMIEEGAGDELYPWRPVCGRWGLHTALAEALRRSETNQGMTKRKPLTADKSPNFYSLKGTGSGSMIATGYDFYDGFSYVAAMQAVEGEGGIIFYLHGTAKNSSCYGWTMVCGGGEESEGRLYLWRRENGRRENLRSFALPVFQNQWYRLSVKLVRDRICGYLDDVLIGEYRGAVPPGGRIGLYADTAGECRFDDILLESTEQLTLENGEDLAFEKLYSTDGFIRKGAAGEAARLAGEAGKRECVYFAGRSHQSGGAFSVDVIPRGKYWNLGICGGYVGEKSSYYRMELSCQPLKNEIRLCRIDKGVRQVLESAPADMSGQGFFSLQMDASESGRLRFSWNRRLVFDLRIPEKLTGAFGVWLGRASAAEFAGWQLLRSFPVFLEQRQKNPIFQKDSFMRHWASPEGQWIGDNRKRIWHKGDFMGDFTLKMPWIHGSCLHLCVADGQTEGKVRLAVRKRGMELSVKEPEDVLPVILRAEVPPKTDLNKLHYRVCHEGYLLWVEADGRMLVRHRLRQPLKRLGTRVRVEGMSIAQLARSQAYRKNVIDEFFYESPYAWQQNGGEWLIINRFQCTPSWSHMIGQNNHGLASLWRKQVFKGDMTLEFYAGTRHGHYSQAGNLNCTLFADSASPSRGYTATVTEWDQNLSQNWSRLYKNGKMLTQSDLYMVPRNRNGHYRRILNPLISGGRPIHGAWFYIKVRKQGNKLEYYFDDELVYAVHDKEEVLQEGMVGIWTFVHSMTLAQIKITFEQVRPRKIVFRELPAHTENRTEKTAGQYVFQGRIGGAKADSLQKQFWKLSENRVGSCRIHALRENPAGLRFENQLGGGDMRLMPVKEEALMLSRIAGWEFVLRLEKQAKINFLYDIQCGGVRHCYQQLNAGSFTRGNVRWMGRTEITPEAFTPRGQRIRIWIPHSVRNLYSSKNSRVIFRGFGSEQLDFQESGIYGNPPGAAYEIREFRPVFYEVPEFSFKEQYVFYGRGEGEKCFGRTPMAVEQLAEFCRSREHTGMNTVELLIRRNCLSGGVIEKVDLLQQKVTWIHLPEQITFRLEPHPVYPETLLLQGNSEYPDYRLANIQLMQGKRQLYFYWEMGRRPPDFRMKQHQALITAVPGEDVIVKYGKRIAGRYVSAEEKTMAARGPVLTDVRGFTKFFYRGANDGRYPVSTDLHVKNYMDCDSGRESLMFSQNSAGSRLRLGMRKQFRIAQYPLLQFSYRADDMANVSLALGNCNVRLTRQDAAGCRSVRKGTDWILDGNWHHWTGVYADGMTGLYENPSFFFLRSVNSRPQTGRYSWLCLADMVFGPAVCSNEQLHCTPVYVSDSPMQSVCWRLSSKPLNQKNIPDQGWQISKPGEELRPDAGSLKDGVNYLCFYGLDCAGRKSAVFSWAFLLDRRKLSVQASVVPSDHVKYNGKLLCFSMNNHGGAPWDYLQAKVIFQNRALALSALDNFHIHDRNSDALELNYPRLLRKKLDQSSNGDMFKLVLSGIRDGAGNQTGDCTAEIKVDYSGDRTPPQWYSFNAGEGRLVGWDWVGYDPVRHFTGERNCRAELMHLRSGNHCMVSRAYYGRNCCKISVDWDPDRHGNLAFRAMMPVFRDGMRVTMHLNTNLKRTLAVSLQKPASGKNQLNRTETYDWKAGKWQNIIIPVKKWLDALKLSEKERMNLRITSVEFQIQRTRHMEEFRLDCFHIYDPAAKNRKLSWSAFDVSGVAGADVSTGKKSGRRYAPDEKIPLADFVAAESEKDGWLKVEAVDKAGNRTDPVWIPFR